MINLNPASTHSGQKLLFFLGGLRVSQLTNPQLPVNKTQLAARHSISFFPSDAHTRPRSQ